MATLHSLENTVKEEDDYLTEIDIFIDGNEPQEIRKKRKARLDALEEMRDKKTLRQQIDYLYDRQFIKMSHNAHAHKKNNRKDA